MARPDFYCICASYYAKEDHCLNDICPEHSHDPEFRVWTTADGKRTPLVRLTDRHLINIIRSMERRCSVVGMSQASEMEAGLSFFQGEMAVLSMETAIEGLYHNAHDPDYVFGEIYSMLVELAESRGLSWERGIDAGFSGWARVRD